MWYTVLAEVSGMPKIRYKVVLTEKERKELLKIISQGKSSAKIIMHANILMASDESNGKGWSEHEIAEQYHVHFQTVHTIRKEYAMNGIEVAIGRKQRITPPTPVKITGDVQARIIAMSCGTPPEGRSRWTLRLLADKSVELEIIDSISYVSIGEILKKTN